MSFAKLKKYTGASLILASLLLANVTGAQTMLAPEDVATSSLPILTEETNVLVEGSSTPGGIPQAAQRGRAIVTNKQRITLPEIRQTRILNLAANISNRMDATVIRLSNISLRLEQRIIKMEESGIDTSLAKEKLVLTNEILATARLKLSDIDTLVNDATYSTEPQTGWQTVKERYQEASSLIRQAHFSLQESILLLKNPVLKINDTATSREAINSVTIN